MVDTGDVLLVAFHLVAIVPFLTNGVIIIIVGLMKIPTDL